MVGGPRQTFDLALQADPPHGGTVMCFPDRSAFEHGEAAFVVAEPAAGWQFTGWFSAEATLLRASDPSCGLVVTGDATVTAQFELLDPTLEIAASLDFPWVSQNTPTATADRHKCVLTVDIVAGAVTGEAYSIALTQDGGAVVDFQVTQPIAMSGTSQTVEILGGRLGASVPSTAADPAYTLTVRVTSSPSGQQDTADVELTLRPLGDIDGDLQVDAQDKLELNKQLNGLATLPGITFRDLDLTGDGVNVDASDKLIMNQRLNGLVSP
jgi:hypothetical protein